MKIFLVAVISLFVTTLGSCNRVIKMPTLPKLDKIGTIGNIGNIGGASVPQIELYTDRDTYGTSDTISVVVAIKNPAERNYAVTKPQAGASVRLELTKLKENRNIMSLDGGAGKISEKIDLGAKGAYSMKYSIRLKPRVLKISNPAAAGGLFGEMASGTDTKLGYAVDEGEYGLTVEYFSDYLGDNAWTGSLATEKKISIR